VTVGYPKIQHFLGKVRSIAHDFQEVIREAAIRMDSSRNRMDSFVVLQERNAARGWRKRFYTHPELRRSGFAD
jgi:hypothetical protein